MHHGNRVAAESLPLPDGLVVLGSFIVALTESREENGTLKQYYLTDAWTGG